LSEFWKQQEELESSQDLETTSTIVRKRSFRSVRHHILQAFNAVDNNTTYDNGSQKKRRQSSRFKGGINASEKAEEQGEQEEGSLDGLDEDDETDNEMADEENEEELGEEQDVDSDESEESTSQSSQGSEYRPVGSKPKPTIASTPVYYLTGNGSADCAKDLWTPWIIEGEDLSGRIWKYREAICQKARKLELLNGSVEKLVLDWKGDRDIKKVLNYLLADDFLWKGVDFNELEMVKHVFDPFLKTFISSIKGGIGRWDKMFPPSQERRKDAHIETTGIGRRPDFFLQCDFSSLKYFVYVMEAKKTSQKTVVQNDLEKVAFLLKDAIDNMARQQVDVAALKVFGMVVVGVEGVIYSMQLVARGIYVMKQYAVLHVPRSQFDLCVVTGTINTFLLLREELVKTMEICRKPHPDKPAELTRPSFGTPIKVNPTGIKNNLPGSPSLRQAVLRKQKFTKK
ncbi:hypothetical protein BGX21_004774, partial [Mortierella sp. AD011]